MSKIRVISQGDVPKERHWIILDFSSIHVPGDERSRTDPGHGYPEHTEPVIDYIAYTDETEWQADVALREHSSLHGPYFAGMVEPARVEVETRVRVH